jgi:hypothetical protein
MIKVKGRLAQLEARHPPEPMRPWATFLWCSPADDAALAAAEQAAGSEGRNIMVIRLVPPDSLRNRPPRRTDPGCRCR